jgi:predicted phosphodiesterase
MTLKNWSDGETTQLITLYRDGYNVRDISKQLGRTRKSITRKLENLNVKRFERKTFKWSEEIKLPQRVIIYGDAIVTSDWHVPYCDLNLAEKVIDTAKKNKIKKIVIAGDFLNLDILSVFVSKPYELDKELDNAYDVWSLLSETFEEIIYLPGNHEWRLNRKLETPCEFRRIVRMFAQETENCKIITSEYDSITLFSENSEWLICHPKNYSQIKNRIAYRLAGKYECNTISAHGHFCGMVVSESGKYVCIDSGGLFDPNKILYAQNTTTYPVWNQGFAMVVGGKPTILSPIFGNC